MNISKINKKNSGIFQLIIMILLTIATQIILLFKTSMTASRFGISMSMDAFNFANSVGTFLFSFIGSGITTILIPKLVAQKKAKVKNEGINIFISFLYTAAFIALILMYVFRDKIIPILVSGNAGFIGIICNILIITLLTQFIMSFSGATNAIFQCNGKFNFPKIVTLITNILLVLMILLDKNLSVYKYAIYIFIISFINILIQLISVKKSKFKFKYCIDLKNKEFLEMLKNFAPIVLSTGLYQVSLITDTMISSRLGAGKISILTYSNTIMTMINALLLSNIITYLYPKIAESINREESQEKLFDLFIVLNAIMSLILVGFIIVGKDGVVLLYERGAFDNSTTNIVFICTLIYMFSLPINALRDLIYRYFYAKGDTLSPFKNSLIISILNIIVSILLSNYIGVYGIILGTVITSYMSLGMILLRFGKKFKIKYNIYELIKENFKIIVVSGIVILIVKTIYNLNIISNIILRLGIYGMLVIVLYLILLYLFKSKIFKINL